MRLESDKLVCTWEANRNLFENINWFYSEMFSLCWILNWWVNIVLIQLVLLSSYHVVFRTLVIFININKAELADLRVAYMNREVHAGMLPSLETDWKFVIFSRLVTSCFLLHLWISSCSVVVLQRKALFSSNLLDKLLKINCIVGTKFHFISSRSKTQTWCKCSYKTGAAWLITNLITI